MWPELRSDRVRWLLPPGETRPQKRFFARMEALRETLNRHLYAGLVAFEAHYALYAPGSHYAPTGIALATRLTASCPPSSV